MICGNNLWKNDFHYEMEEQIHHGVNFQVYSGLSATLYDSLAESAKAYPDNPAIVAPDGASYTYSRFLEMVDAFASYLHCETGIAPGDHVGLLMYNSIEFCTAFLAVNKLGAVTVPLPGKFKKQELLSLIEKGHLQLLICHEDYEDWFKEDSHLSDKLLVSRETASGYGFSAMHCSRTFPDPVIPKDAPAILMFTSGTTSKSKGVYLANYSVMHAVASYQKIFHITSEDRTLLAVPIYHITGLLAILGMMLYAGGTTYLHKFFHPRDALKTMKEEKITFFHASPTVFSMLLQEQDAAPSLPDMKILACGSSNMAKEKIYQLHKWMPQMEFRTIYGLTETASPAAVFPCDAAKSPFIGSSGIPIPGLCIKIADENGQELPVGESGEILMQGTNLLTQYYGTEIPAYIDGWFHTGDLGYFNEEGYLFIADRKKDMINRGGEKICSYDVENVLYSMEQIEEAAIVGIPDDIYGEVAAAAIVTKPGASLTLEEMQAYLKDKLAKYKIPVKLLVLDEFPVTPNHKTDKKAIKQLFLNELSKK